MSNNKIIKTIGGSRKQTKSKKSKKTRTIKNIRKHLSNKFSKISPANLLKLFSTNKVAIVNTLDDNIVLNSSPINLVSSYGKNFINKSCSEINKFEAIICYCANHTCNASHNYAIKLVKKCKNIKKKIVLYEGGIYEWALLYFSFPELYTFANIQRQSQLSHDEIKNYFIKMNHRNISEDNNNYPHPTNPGKRLILNPKLDPCSVIFY